MKTTTLVYRYGCLPPTEKADLVDQQISLAHKYQNKLIEFEHQRRKGRDAIRAI